MEMAFDFDYVECVSIVACRLQMRWVGIKGKA
jgi:hypothetical protein